MRDYSINQNDQYYTPQNQNQPDVEQPDPQSYMPPEAQMEAQPYTQQVNEQNLIQNVIQPDTQLTPQTPETNLAKVTPQQYASLPYIIKPGIGEDHEDFKSKLRRPIIFTWVLFVLEIIYTIIYIISIKIINGVLLNLWIIECIPGIIQLIVAMLTTISVAKMNVRIYNNALTIYTLYSFYLIYIIISLLVSNTSLNDIWTICYIARGILKIILLLVLFYFKKEFNKL